MAGSVFDSPLYSKLFAPGEAGRLFTDTAEVRAMLLVEGALAKVQGELGVIPEDSAFFIHRSAMEVQIDPAGLAASVGTNGVPVPGLLAEFRKAMEAPDHSQYVHWGATSQDIVDTAMMLRLRQLLGLCDTALSDVLTALAERADAHAATPMAARTWGQHATVTTFGAQVAEWGQPMADLHDELTNLIAAGLPVSLSGAAGTANALGPKARETRAALAKALGLTDPGRSWHVDRGPVLRVASWLTRLTVALGKMGEDVSAMMQTGIGEITLVGAGGSSTMPQKQNPVAPSALVTLARMATALNAALQGAGMPRAQRDGAAMMTEWMSLPQLALGAAAALNHAKALSDAIAPNTEAMEAALDGQLGLIHAEALSFALASRMPRPDAQATTKALCQEAVKSATPLDQLVARDWPDLDSADLFRHEAQTGTAADDARAFASRVRTGTKA
ncbi:lyase family protein [Shimia biformata]|uniref:lyase family protein n=1 Tax=Shimia biformata TaxID=1294299 RepID=UPI0019517911|nr:lyase family protein [Shimia biformata]